MRSPILEPLRSALAEHRAGRSIVGFSGGLDSSVLMHGLVSLCPKTELRALHVNHGLDARADAWEAHCRRVCSAWAVPLDVVKLDLARGAGLEQRARDARYAAFAGRMRAGDRLLLAHHRDDQIETIFLRLMRGGGAVGVAGMPRQRRIGAAVLVRPLLDVSRAEIERYARDVGIEWVEDPSNESEHFDRNYIRHRLLPIVEARWPGYRQVMARSSALLEDAALLMREIAAEDMRGRLLDDGRLSVGDLDRLSELRQLNLLRGWLARHDVPTPSRNRLHELLRQCASGGDRGPCVRFGMREVRRYRDALHVVRPFEGIDERPTARWSPPDRLDWCGGALWAERCEGGGLRAEGLDSLDVRIRRQGERVRPSGRPTRPLKKLLQEACVPPWLRFRLPVLVVGDEAVAVPGVFVAEGWQARGKEPGWKIHWRAD